MGALEILELATGLYKLGSSAYDKAVAARDAEQKAGEWTEKQEAAWVRQSEALFASPAWQPTDGKVYNLEEKK